jgi:hypothetical protein
MTIGSDIVVGLAVAIVVNSLQPEPSVGSPPFNGRLYAVVSRWEPPVLDVSRDGVRLPAEARPRFERFVRCVTSFRSRLPDSTDFFTDSARPHQRVLERALACSANAADAPALAAEYSAHATLVYEWEGFHTSPLEEAAYAEQFIHEHPTSPLVPFLSLFVAERMRYALELLNGAVTDSEMVSLAERYDNYIARARAADPLIRLIADDLDGLSFVYRDVGKHPKNVVRRKAG